MTNSKIRVELAREVARVQGQSAGKEEDSDTSHENEPLFVPKSAQVVSGRRYHRLRNLVEHPTCRDGRLEESLIRKAVSSLAARRSHQTALGKFSNCAEKHVSPGRRHRSQRCPSCVSERLLCVGSSTSPCFTASCCRDVSLAVTQQLRVQPLAWESSSCGSANPLSAGSVYIRPSTFLEMKKKDLGPSLVPFLPCESVRDHSLRNESIYQDRSPRWVGLRGPKLVSMRQQAFAPAKVWKSGGDL